MSKTYLFEPKSPLVLRTGRPFDQAGDPVSLACPLPSTMAGACRTAIADAASWDFKEKKDDLLKISVHGPLAAIIENDTPTHLLLPRPADALFMQKPKEKGAFLNQLVPRPLRDGEITDLPHGELCPVFLQDQARGKPADADPWWEMEAMESWLTRPGHNSPPATTCGWQGPAPGLRTHVALSSDSKAAKDGKLFQTEGVSFESSRKDETRHNGWRTRRHGLVVHLPDQEMNASFCRLGGEGRICAIRQRNDPPGWPTMPRAIHGSKFIRLILATPAIFRHGWRPDWLDDALVGSPPGQDEITLKLHAFVTPRWQPVSGWDLQERKPRPVSRMVPAGAVYWFEVRRGKDKLDKLWLAPVSDDGQDRRNGYGLALIGKWERQ